MASTFSAFLVCLVVLFSKGNYMSTDAFSIPFEGEQVLSPPVYPRLAAAGPNNQGLLVMTVEKTQASETMPTLNLDGNIDTVLRSLKLWMSGAAECGGRTQQQQQNQKQKQQPMPEWTEMAADGGVVRRRDTNGEKNLIRPNNQFLYKLVKVFSFFMTLLCMLCSILVLYPIQRRSEKDERSNRSLISGCIFLLGTLECSMLSSRAFVIHYIGKGGCDESKEGGGGGGDENRRRAGGRMDPFTGLGLSSNVLLFQKFSEYLRRGWGSREAGGGRRHGDHRTDSEAMGIGNTEGTRGGDGGQGGGGSDDGRDGSQGGGESGDGGDAAMREGDRNLTPIVNFSKLSKISIAVSAQTSGAIISFYFSSPSSLNKILLVSTLLTSLLSYLFSLSSILLNHKRPWVAGILGAIGIATSALGFIQMIALSLPATLIWIVVLACVAFLLVFAVACGLCMKDG